MADRPEIAALLREGRHREAAELLRRQGEGARAMELYAQVWAFDEAADVALELPDPVAALRYLLDGKRIDRITAMRVLLREGDPAVASRAAALLETRRMFGAAAELSEAAGDLDAAARQYASAMDLPGAARCLEALGRYREAGRAYEQRLRDAPDDAHASLQLGRILLRFGRNEVAARHLQAAARSPETAVAAMRALVVALHALGMVEAARSNLDDLRRLDPTAPLEVRGLLEQWGPGGGPERDEARWLAGRYRVERLLGGGSAGRVYLARDSFYDREVAVKVFSASSSGPDGRDAYARFVREARISAALHHPHVVSIFEFNAESAFLVMEHMVGGTLQARLEAQAWLPLGQVRTVVLGVLEALDASHARGVVHRDVKPPNIFFDGAGTVKLGDFGTAHLLDLGATQTGAFLGTLAYMAPEQITGGRVDGTTDLYALGVVLYRMLTGALPFTGPDFVAQHLSETPVPPSRRRPALGDAYDLVIARVLAKAPEDRFRSATEMADHVRSAPWIDPAREGEPAGADAPRAQEPRVEPTTEEARFEVLGPQVGARVELHDKVLGRRVLRLTVTPERLELLARYGAVSSPYVQSVLRVDRARAEAWLELPGEPAPGGLRHPDVARGLEALHRAGLVHGNLSDDQVRIDEAGAVLLVDGASGEGTPEADRARLVDEPDAPAAGV